MSDKEIKRIAMKHLKPLGRRVQFIDAWREDPAIIGIKFRWQNDGREETQYVVCEDVL